MKKAYLTDYFTKGVFFCQFFVKNVVGLMPEYYVLAGDASQVYIFSLHKITSTLKQEFSSSPNFASLLSVMKDNSSVHFSSNNIYFAQKEPIKMKIFETFNCSGQICQIPHVNFETTSQFLSKFFIILQYNYI